jgi:2-polyprenyl-3-methyl-5-hydroxy-6-metoxy-1,4-benzoquinol methylase
VGDEDTAFGGRTHGLTTTAGRLDLMMRTPPFSFGKNWHKYLDSIPEDAVESMSAYVAQWLGPDLGGRRVVDIGSGQGLTSLAAFRLGASVLSFDVDPESVAATMRLWQWAGSPSTWRVEGGDILDHRYVTALGVFDVVISWGVLHHTGAMWTALDHASSLTAPGGTLWIALYHRTPQSGRSARLKRLYLRVPAPAKAAMRGGYATAKVVKSLLLRRRLPAMRGSYDRRGMSWWRDIEDWLGGYPYEVSSPGQVLAHLRPAGFELRRLDDAVGEGLNDVYLFDRHTYPAQVGQTGISADRTA